MRDAGAPARIGTVPAPRVAPLDISKLEKCGRGDARTPPRSVPRHPAPTPRPRPRDLPAHIWIPYRVRYRDGFDATSVRRRGKMARHPWVAEADRGLRWGVQLIVPNEQDALSRLIETGRMVEDLGYDALFVL